MASIKIPTPLRPYAGNSAEIEVQGATVGEALASLTAQHPDLRTHLFDGEDLRSFVNVFVGEEDIRICKTSIPNPGRVAAADRSGDCRRRSI
jgi:adenylyltransferase/sulfurtransferase